MLLAILELNMIDNAFYSIKEKPEVFPLRWSCRNVTKDDVLWRAGEYYRSGVFKTKSRLNSCYWKKASLERLIRSDGEGWNFNDELVICVWEINQAEKEPPIGFVSFSFVWEETRFKKINCLDIEIGLIWIRPDKRRFGGAEVKHVLAHLLFYFEACKIVFPYASPRGVKVYCQADVFSHGGKKASSIIADYLEYMKDIGLWRIKDIEFAFVL